MYTEETPVQDNVIDMIEYRLLKKFRDAESDLEAEVADALLDLYQTGRIDATVEEGVLMFQSVEVFGDSQPVGILWGPEEIELP
jgi:propanediol dehydratase small subunit